MTQTKKKARKSIVTRLVMLIMAAYAVVMLVDMQVSLSERKQELEQIKQQFETQRLENKELERQLALGVDEEYVERTAREKLDYVSPNEKVFIDISGS